MPNKDLIFVGNKKEDEKYIFDHSLKEAWIISENNLINETKDIDHNINEKNKYKVPLPDVDVSKFNDISYILENKIYLGTEDGLYKYNGKKWKLLKIEFEKYEEAFSDWPWASSFNEESTNIELCKRLDTENVDKIEVADPFPGKRKPKGKYYEIIEKAWNNSSWLREIQENGDVNEYKFLPPFYATPDDLFVDYNGNIWAIGTHYLYFFDGENMKTYSAKNTKNFTNDHIYSFAAEPDGSVWVGTEGGLFVFKDGKCERPSKRISGTIFSMIYDAVGKRLFVSSTHSGTFIKEGERWSEFKTPYDKDGGYYKDFARCFYIEGDGTIWMATNSGLRSYSEKNKRWIRFSSELNETVTVKNSIVYVSEYHPSYILKKVKED